MEILETIPVYGPADWVFSALIISVIISVIVAIVFHDTEKKWVGIIFLVSSLFLIFNMCAIIWDWFLEYKYDKYIIKISPEVTFTEVDAKYKILKHYDYSDVYEVKEK